MKIGASTKSFGGKTVKEVAEIFARCGLTAAELCFCQSDLPGFRHNLCGSANIADKESARCVAETFKSFGVDICSVGVYCNFWSGTDSEIFDTLKLFTSYCDIAYSLGVRTLSTHTGTANQIALSKSFGNELCEKMYQGFTCACIEAKKRGLTVAVECSELDAVQDYKGFTKLCGYVGKSIGSSDMLKYIYSPAKCENVSESQIGIFHIKDKSASSKYFERFGDGDVDFSGFFKAFGRNEDIPVILEYVNSENLCDTVKRYKCALASTENA